MIPRNSFQQVKKWIYSAQVFLNIAIQSGNKASWEQKQSFNYSTKKKTIKTLSLSLSY